MPEQARGSVRMMDCLIERGLRELGLEMVKDGSKQPTDIEWLKEPTFFTRVYRARIKWPTGDTTDIFVKFIYDRRKNFADIALSNEGLETLWRALNGEGGTIVRGSDEKDGSADGGCSVVATKEVPQP